MSAISAPSTTVSNPVSAKSVPTAAELVGKSAKQLADAATRWLDANGYDHAGRSKQELAANGPPCDALDRAIRVGGFSGNSR